MKATLKILATALVLASSLTAFAADQKKADIAPKGTPIYPCWDAMQNGHMKQMRGMWRDGQGGYMMMSQQDVQKMQQEIKELREQVEQLKKKP